MAVTPQQVQEWETASVSREWAAEVLRKFAEAGRVGLCPTDVNLWDLGRALHRIGINYPVGSPLVVGACAFFGALSHGWEEQESYSEGPEAYAYYLQLPY